MAGDSRTPPGLTTVPSGQVQQTGSSVPQPQGTESSSAPRVWKTAPSLSKEPGPSRAFTAGSRDLSRGLTNWTQTPDPQTAWGKSVRF